jgi:GNAT superfamily N-acetyltransferase
MTDLTVSVVRPADLTALVESVKGLVEEDSKRHDPYRNPDWAEREGAEYYAGIVDDPAVLLLLARDGEQAIGHLVGKLREPTLMFPDRYAILESLRVAPAARRQGIGSWLVEEFFGWLRARGAARALVTAYTANEGARRLYARHGFVPHEVTMQAPV